MSKKTKT